MLTLAVVAVSYGIKIRTVDIEVKELKYLHAREDSKWLVYTDVGLMENTESILHKKLCTRDLQKQLQEGARYTVVVEGFTLALLDLHPNIIRIEKIISGYDSTL